MFHGKKRLLAGVMAAVMTLALATPAMAAEEDIMLISAKPEYLTRQEVRDILIAAADDYNPGVKAEDILQGDDLGALRLDDYATHTEALLMLERAFGGIPAPNAAWEMSANYEEFQDEPYWAIEELMGALNAGIIVGDGQGSMLPGAYVTEDELETLIKRVYALEGANLKDDFYAAVNKEWLDNATLPQGYIGFGAMAGMSMLVDGQIAQLIAELAAEKQAPGTPEYKIAAVYHSILDTETRDAQGVEPIQKYLDAIDAAKSVAELAKVDCMMYEELGVVELMIFSLTTDLADSSRYIGYYGTFSPSMEQSFYAQPDPVLTEAYVNYRAKCLEIAGYNPDFAREQAELVYEAEAMLAEAMLSPEEQNDINNLYNLYTLDELQEVFPNIDVGAYYKASGLKTTDTFMVPDVGLMEALASLCDDEHLDTLKALVRKELLKDLGSYLTTEFGEASMDFNVIYYGVSREDVEVPIEQTAASQVQSMLADYLSEAYVNAYFSAEAKADVEDMIADFIAVYKERIMALDWMGDETKEMAVKKLDNMGVKVGYPDSWETPLDNVKFKDPADGGTYFSNYMAVVEAGEDALAEMESKGPDKSQWIAAPYEVNAFYNPQANDITFPAAILQAPMYDVNASREENLGGIGFVIAHEITHAFDDTGAMFDEKGNQVANQENPTGWWTMEDYYAFVEKCDAVAAWYDGQEAVPGFPCNGSMTLGENVADLGSAKCILEITSQEAEPDYKALFESMAKNWTSCGIRSYQKLLSEQDTHAADKLRVNRVLQTLDQFYETYDIQPGDGMWTEPEERVSIW